MTLRYYMLVISILAFLNVELTAQKLDHVLGDVLVQLPMGSTPDRAIHMLQNRDRSLRILTNQVLKTPVNIWIFHIDPNISNENIFLELVRDIPFIENAQRNHITQLRTIPNDEKFTSQWQYINTGSNGGIANADLDMDLAWDITTGGVTPDGDTIVVCVVDDGVNIAHPDLQGNLWVNYGEIPNNGIDDDNNGYIDDRNGWNAYNGTDIVDVDGSHGTSVTGIIGARGNNEIGVAGMNWNIKVMTVVGGTPESTALASYGYAYTQRKLYNDTDGNKGAFVVATNSSWGVNNGDPEDAPIWCDFYNIMGDIGILSVAATANMSIDVDTEGDLPTACSSDFLIAVTNMMRNDNKVSGAGYGIRSIDLGAYSEDTYTLSKSDYDRFGGTSGASPHVAGMIGLLYSAPCDDFIAIAKNDPRTAALMAKDFILLGTTPNASLDGRTTTGGRLNANTSLLNIMSICDESCSISYGAKVDNPQIFDVSVNIPRTENTGEVLFRYKRLEDTQWTEMTSSASNLSLVNLESCTEYEYQTATTCNDTLSSFSYSKIFKTEGCCEAPEILSVELDDDVAIISWGSTVGSSSYTIEYRIRGTQDWATTVNDGETTTLSIPNIAECTSYEVRVMTSCDIVDIMSDFTTYQFSGPCGNCTAEYCIIDPKDTRDEWIEKVAIQNIFENISGDNDGSASFIGMFDIVLEKDSTYNIILEPGYSATIFADLFSVYIDFDQNGVLGDTEAIYLDQSAVSEEVSGEFTVPTNARLGITRMRVLMRFAESNEISCDQEQWVFGEHEDYCVEITGEETCPTFIALESDIDSSKSTLAFELTPSSKLISYDIQYRPLGATEFTELVFTSESILLENLMKCTTYEVLYAANCEDDVEVHGGELTLKTSCALATESPTSEDIIVFPSPAEGSISIKLTTVASMSSLSIYDIHGSLVLSKKIESQEEVINVHETKNFSSGIYIVQLTVGKEVLVKKWMKL